MKKITFFDQNHGLTPLKKCDLWDCQKFLFSWSYFRQKEKMKKKWHFFVQKHGLTPLEKKIYGSVVFFSIVKKGFLSI